MTRLIFILLLAVTVAFLLAGCGPPRHKSSRRSTSGSGTRRPVHPSHPHWHRHPHTRVGHHHHPHVHPHIGGADGHHHPY